MKEWKCLSKTEKKLFTTIEIIYGKSFDDVYIGEQIIYMNSLYRTAVAINQGNFARAYSIGTGINWTIEFKKI